MTADPLWQELHPACGVTGIVSSPYASRVRISACDQSIVVPAATPQKLPLVPEYDE